MLQKTLIIALAAVILSGCAPRSRPVQVHPSEMAEIDRLILRGMFKPRLGSLDVGVQLKATYPGRQPGEVSVWSRYSERAEAFYHAHHSQMAANADYREAFAELEWRVVRDFTAVNAREGSRFVFDQIVRNGMAAALLETARPTQVFEVPVPIRNDPMDYPFMLSGFTVTDEVRRSVAPFHCCSGRLVVSDMGKPYSKFVRAHRRLIGEDSRYASQFRRLLRDMASRLDRAKTERPEEAAAECLRVTREFRRALENEGLAARLEAAVARDRPDRDLTKPMNHGG